MISKYTLVTLVAASTSGVMGGDALKSKFNRLSQVGAEAAFPTYL